jgi:large subunit ribosomal protein L6
MSKIGKKHIAIPAGVKVAIDGNKISMEGPKGKKELTLNTEHLETKIENNAIVITPKKNNRSNQSFLGTAKKSDQ